MSPHVFTSQGTMSEQSYHSTVHSGPHLARRTHKSSAQWQVGSRGTVGGLGCSIRQAGPSGPVARHWLHGAGWGSRHALFSPIQGLVLSDTKQNWLGLGAVSNIYISNLCLAAVSMATRPPSNKAAECYYWPLPLLTLRRNLESG